MVGCPVGWLKGCERARANSSSSSKSKDKKESMASSECSYFSQSSNWSCLMVSIVSLVKYSLMQGPTRKGTGARSEPV